MKKIFIIILSLASFKQVVGQEVDSAVSFLSSREFDLFDLFGKPRMRFLNRVEIKNGFAVLHQSGSELIDIKITFPKTGSYKPITVRIRNISGPANKIFVSDSGIFSPVFTREYSYKNYFTDSIFHIDTGRILLSSVLASNMSIGAETYKLISKVNDTIFVENVYPFANDVRLKCLAIVGSRCFTNSYYSKRNNKETVDNYLEKWFIQDNKLIQYTFNDGLLKSKHFFKLINNSFFISFLYRYPLRSIKQKGN